MLIGIPAFKRFFEKQNKDDPSKRKDGNVNLQRNSTLMPNEFHSFLLPFEVNPEFRLIHQACPAPSEDMAGLARQRNPTPKKILDPILIQRLTRFAESRDYDDSMTVMTMMMMMMVMMMMMMRMRMRMRMRTMRMIRYHLLVCNPIYPTRCRYTHNTSL